MKIDGVTACEVSFADKLATVMVKEGTDPETIASELTWSRFTGKVKQ